MGNTVDDTRRWSNLRVRVSKCAEKPVFEGKEREMECPVKPLLPSLGGAAPWLEGWDQQALRPQHKQRAQRPGPWSPGQPTPHFLNQGNGVTSFLPLHSQHFCQPCDTLFPFKLKEHLWPPGWGDTDRPPSATPSLHPSFNIPPPPDLLRREVVNTVSGVNSTSSPSRVSSSIFVTCQL